MSIQIGDSLPDLPIQRIDQGSHAEQTGQLLRGRCLLFGVPGAFTPTCSKQHLPGYVAALEVFRQHGIAVFCLAVNDAYVMQAWATAQQVPAGLGMLADGNGDFVLALGLELDGRAYGMGLRARRFALYAEDGVVRQLQIEAPGEFGITSANAMLATLGLHAPPAVKTAACGC